MVKRVSKRVSEIVFLIAAGGSTYYLIEIWFRGFSHWTMFVLGGVALTFCSFQGEVMHWVGMRIVQQPLARHKVPHHHHGGGDKLAHVGTDQIFGALRDIRIMVHAVRGNPDDGVVHKQADHRADHEDDDLHPASHVLTMLEHHLHAGDIVEDQRDDKRDGGGEHVVHVEGADENV